MAIVENEEPKISFLKSKKLPMVLAAVFFLLLPLLFLASTQKIKIFKRAYLPISPPISPPDNSICQAVNGVIDVTPEGDIFGTCHDIQQAIDIARERYTIRLLRHGTYKVKKHPCFVSVSTSSNFSCGIEIIGNSKNYIKIVGEGDGFSAVDFNGATHGINIVNTRGIKIENISFVNITGNHKGVNILNGENIEINHNSFSYLNTHPVFLENSKNIIVKGNQFSTNDGAVPGVHFVNSEGKVLNNLFFNNLSAPINIHTGSKAEIYDNTFGGNQGSIYVGGGNDPKSNVVIKNNIFNNNLQSSAIHVQEGNNVFVDYNLFWKTVSNTSGNVSYGRHNVISDPLFATDTGEIFCLLPGSPAIGAGENGTDIGTRGRCEGECVPEGHGIPVIPDSSRMVCCPGLILCPPPEGILGVKGICQRTCDCSLKPYGDANCDNKINLSDFFIWRNEFLQTISGPAPQCLPPVEAGEGEDNPTAGCVIRPYQADFNNDRKVNLQDFFTWRNGFLSSLKPDFN